MAYISSKKPIHSHDSAIILKIFIWIFALVSFFVPVSFVFSHRLLAAHCVDWAMVESPNPKASKRLGMELTAAKTKTNLTWAITPVCQMLEWLSPWHSWNEWYHNQVTLYWVDKTTHVNMLIQQIYCILTQQCHPPCLNRCRYLSKDHFRST